MSRRSLTIVWADADSREGPAGAWWLIRLRGGSCQINRSTAGTARGTANHPSVAAAMITAAVAGTTATGARAASCGRGPGGCPPASRASSGGNAKAMRIRAASPVTLCVTSSVPSVWMGLTERGEHSSDLEGTSSASRRPPMPATEEPTSRASHATLLAGLTSPLNAGTVCKQSAR